MTETVGVHDVIEVGLPREIVPAEFPCPKCDRATKDANTRQTTEVGLDLRICSAKPCRHMADWSSGVAAAFDPMLVQPESEPEVPSAILEPVAEAAVPICANCGKVTKDANTLETRAEGRDIRICSNRRCRLLVDVALL